MKGIWHLWISEEKNRLDDITEALNREKTIPNEEVTPQPRSSSRPPPANLFHYYPGSLSDKRHREIKDHILNYDCCYKVLEGFAEEQVHETAGEPVTKPERSLFPAIFQPLARPWRLGGVPLYLGLGGADPIAGYGVIIL